MQDWLDSHPDIRTVRAIVADLNGQARGKRYPSRFGNKLVEAGVRMPLSALNVDIRGEDIANSPLVFETGDQDGVLRPTERGYLPAPWLASPSALLPMWMSREDGTPFPGDPRHALDTVLSRYDERGWTPLCATELEFYLIDDSTGVLQPPPSPRSGKRRLGGEVLSIRALDAFDDFFTDLYAACEDMDIPAESAISESGMGQFEVNLSHGPAMKTADDTFFFKMLVHGLARRHGFAASFMAKPYAEHAGNGLHMHFSVLNAQENNIFDDGSDAGSPLLRQAIAGCLDAMPDSTLIFAPHGSSYDRFVPGAHAPTGISWGYENRTTAIRVPSGPSVARRIEHRLAGGDINPFLFVAAVLGAALIGIEDAAEPPPPLTGNAYAKDHPRIPDNWADAIIRFESSDLLPRIFSAELLRNFALTKRQEIDTCGALPSAERIDLYLDTV